MKKSKTFSKGFAIRGGQSLVAVAIAAFSAGIVAQGTQIEEIVVTGTGTSIRGEAPVGQNLISIGREAIQESGAVSVQQILNDVPQITGFGNAAQGSYGSSDGSGTFAPTIHSLGASASNSTLTVINGHRLPLSGISHNLGDPSIIPPAAIERVEILPDGASATYGSDAVAGVLNFITRTDVEGVELSSQAGFSDGYKTGNVNILWGSSWGDGSFTAAYAYSYRSALANADRPKIASNLTNRGGGNYSSFNCGPTLMDFGSNQRFDAPYGPTNTVSAADCDTRAYTDLMPSELRHSIFVGWEQDYGDNLKADMEVVYSERDSQQASNRGTYSTPSGFDIRAAGNPFFVADPTGANRNYTARWDATTGLGSAAQTESGARTLMVSGGLEYDFGNDWYLSVSGTTGFDQSYRNVTGTICSSCVTDALSSTSTANALNIWGAAGRTAAGGVDTSANTLRYILDDAEQALTTQTLMDLSVKVDGTLMALPAGDLKVAFGANRIQYDADYDLRRGVDGPSSTAAQTTDIYIPRDVDAIFGEALIPVTERVSFSAAVRYDDYSDFGSTTNPRIAAQWHINDWLKVRVSWAESFVAPALSSRGETGTGRTTESSFSSNTGSGFIPVNFSDPRTAQFLTWVQSEFPASQCSYDGGGALLGCNVGSGGLSAARVSGGNDGLKAATGETKSIGFDLTHPDWLPGLRANITYYDALLNQMVTAPTLTNIISVPGLNNRIILLPTQAEWDDWTVGLPQSGALPVNNNLPPGAAYGWAWSFQQINAFNIDSAGIDFDLSYSWDTDMGEFTVDWKGNRKLRFDQQAGTGGVWIDYLNTDANTTFSSLEYLATHSLGWRGENMSAKLTWKYTNGYDGTSTARTQKVDASNVFNFYGSYDIEREGLLGNTQLFLQVQNLLDEEPPFLDTNGGYNSSESSPLGRMMTVGFRKTF